MRRFVWAALMACSLPVAVCAQSREEIDFMKGFFTRLQEKSFQKRSEYCGFVVRCPVGQLRVTQPLQGNRDSCSLEWPDDMEVTASYHTHDAFELIYYNELPSDLDMQSDQELEVNGWIATPGGRLWYIDSEQMVATQVCGVGCLPVAPNFYKAQAGDIAPTYTFDELLERLQR